MDVTHVRANADMADVVEFKRREPYLGEPIRLVGGSQISLVPDDDDFGDISISLGAASAALRVEGRNPMQMDGTVGTDPESNEPLFRFDVPDVKGSAVIEFNVDYSDDCFTYHAEGAWAFEMVRAAFGAACPTDSEGFVTHWAAMGEPPIDVGGVGVDLSPDEMIGLWNPGAIGVQGNSPLSHWDADADSSVVDSGGVVSLRSRNPDLRIVTMSATFYRRGAVVNGGGDPPQVFVATADPFPDGHLDLLVPADPGRYVVGLVVRWETPCLRGGAVGAQSIDVE